MRANSARRRAARRRAAVVLLACVAATACTSGAHRYRSLSEDWERSAPADRPARSEASLFEGVPSLERRELVQLVLERNASVRAARYAWRAALERHPQVTALDDPMVGVGAAPRSFGSSEVDDAARFDLSQKLPFPGKLGFKGEAALAEAEAASHDFEAVRLRLATLASILFDDYYLAARSLEINAAHVTLLEEFQQIATARYESGGASQQDPIQAEVVLTHALHRDIELRSAQRVAAERINALLQRTPGEPLPPPPANVAIPAAPPEAPDALIAAALAAKPEVAAAGARVASEQARLALARREYFPDLTVTGAYDGLWQEDDLKPFVGVQLDVPLQLGRRKAAVAEAEARVEGAHSEQLAIETDVRLAVQVGVARLEEARHVEHLLRERQAPAARDQVEAARSGFETGRNSFLALIDAERNLLDVELGYQEALANLSRRRAELDRALGRIPGLEW